MHAYGGQQLNVAAAGCVGRQPRGALLPLVQTRPPRALGRAVQRVVAGRIHRLLALRARPPRYGHLNRHEPGRLVHHGARLPRRADDLAGGARHRVDRLGSHLGTDGEEGEDAVIYYYYLAEISYDGTDYKGFQLQPRPTVTVQLVLERALCHFLHVDREFVRCQASSRTDAGVHARQLFVEFRSPRELDEGKFVRFTNRLLPDDVAVHSLRQVTADFNVRYTLGKIYTYDVHTDRRKDVFLSRYRKAHPEPLDVSRMRSACERFVGEHDFRLLSEWTSRPDDVSASTIRRVFDVRVVEIDGGLRIVVHGAGFLHKMVRNIVGVLLSVGEGSLSDDDVSLLLRAGDDDDAVREQRRMKAKFKVAEGRGLTLRRVFLPGDYVDDHVYFE